MTESTKPRVDPGLCATCRHAQQVETPRALYWMCRLSFTDPRFPKYPRLPVRSCDGYEPTNESEPTSRRGA